jgi:hypothetical protein
VFFSAPTPCPGAVPSKKHKHFLLLGPSDLSAVPLGEVTVNCLFHHKIVAQDHSHKRHEITGMRSALQQLVVAVLATAAAASSCASSFNVVSGSPFPYAYGFLNDNISTWNEGDNLCASLLHPNARMAIIRDNLVQNYFVSQQRWYWIGANQTSVVDEPSGGWKWTDGSSLNGSVDDPRYFLWSDGYPSDTTRSNCALFTFQSGAQDGICTFSYNVACEVHCNYLHMLIFD